MWGQVRPLQAEVALYRHWDTKRKWPYGKPWLKAHKFAGLQKYINTQNNKNTLHRFSFRGKFCVAHFLGSPCSAAPAHMVMRTRTRLHLPQRLAFPPTLRETSFPLHDTSINILHLKSLDFRMNLLVLYNMMELIAEDHLTATGKGSI